MKLQVVLFYIYYFIIIVLLLFSCRGGGGEIWLCFALEERAVLRNKIN